MILQRCAHCGTTALRPDLYCASCGQVFIPDVEQPAALPGSGASALPAPANAADSRTWATVAHLTALAGALLGGVAAFVGPLVIWLLRRDADSFAAAHAREALNFNLSVLIYAAVGGILSVLGTILTLGLGLLAVIPLALVAVLGYFVVSVLGAVAASQGRPFHYPLSLPLVS